MASLLEIAASGNMNVSTFKFGVHELRCNRKYLKLVITRNTITRDRCRTKRSKSVDPSATSRSVSNDAIPTIPSGEKCTTIQSRKNLTVLSE